MACGSQYLSMVLVIAEANWKRENTQLQQYTLIEKILFPLVYLFISIDDQTRFYLDSYENQQISSIFKSFFVAFF